MRINDNHVFKNHYHEFSLQSFFIIIGGYHDSQSKLQFPDLHQKKAEKGYSELYRCNAS